MGARLNHAWELLVATLAVLALSSMAVLVGSTLYYVGGLPCLLTGCAATVGVVALIDWWTHRGRR